MDSLRELLKERNPALHAALVKTWEYLEKSILPLVNAKGESLNSLPHLLDNEDYLSGILPVREQLFDKNQLLFLSPHELYVILASIYLHDIGRIKCNAGHGAESKKMINKLWRELNIPSKELAETIADICLIHEPNEKSEEKNPEITIVLDYIERKIIAIPTRKTEIHKVNSLSYSSGKMLDNNNGFVRVNELGALLSLVDNMDATYRRLVKLEILNIEKYSTPLGLLRECIKGVTYDRECQSILVTIDFKKTKDMEIILDDNLTDIYKNVLSGAEKNEQMSYDTYLKRKSPDLNSQKIKKKCLFPERSDALNRQSELEWLLINGVYVDSFGLRIKKFDMQQLQDLKNACEKEGDNEIAEIIIIYNQNVYIKWNNYVNNKVRIDSKIQKKYAEILKDFNGFEKYKTKKVKIPDQILIPMILGNISDCHFSMLKKYKYLSRLGIPVKSWLIYFKEHLYNSYGEETYEPVFSKEYLIHIAETMWKLSTRVFGQSFFTYEMLASAASEKDLKLIKLAVKRLEVLSRDASYDQINYSAINYNPIGWQWEYPENTTSNQCEFLRLSRLKSAIEILGDPLFKSQNQKPNENESEKNHTGLSS